MSTCSTTFLVGGTARIEFRPVPDTGTVALADVTFKVRAPNGTEQTLTPVVEESTNVFTFDFPIPAAGPRGKWRVRATSSAPSATIAEETTFTVNGSAFDSP